MARPGLLVIQSSTSIDRAPFPGLPTANRGTVEVELASGALADLHPTAGARRGVVLACDLGGRRRLFDDFGAALAATHNWNVIVVDPFRDQDANPLTAEERDERVGALDDDDVVADLVDAANRLEAEPVALIGFSLGGMYAYKAAASLRFDRIVSFYGMVRLPNRWRGPAQREPLGLLSHVEDRASILAVVGTDDPYLPGADIDELISLGVKVARYPGARHDFVHDPSLPVHRPRDSKDAWNQVFDHLAGSDLLRG